MSDRNIVYGRKSRFNSGSAANGGERKLLIFFTMKLLHGQSSSKLWVEKMLLYFHEGHEMKK
jgi:hypothetical protein